MITEDKYFIISSDEINRLYVILDYENDATEAMFYLDTIIASKVMTTDSKYGDLIFFD